MNELPDKKESRTDFEISQIEKELEIMSMLKSIMNNSELDEIQIRAAASSLHSIYNGIEKILLLKLKDLNPAYKADGSKWHAELLIKSNEYQLISIKLEESLREIMGFRHFYRHAYGFMLDKELLEPLILSLKNIFENFKKEINY